MILSELLAKKKVLVLNLTANVLSVRQLKKAIQSINKTALDILAISFCGKNCLGQEQVTPVILCHEEINLAKIITILKELQPQQKVPLLFYTSTNIILGYGLKQFFAEAKQAGLSGLIITDLPAEESKDFLLLARQNQMELIYTLAENTIAERITGLAECTGSFLRLALSKKILANKKEVSITRLKETVDNIRTLTTKPLLLETDVTQPENIQRLLSTTDGIILTNQVISEQFISPRRAEKQLKKLIKEIDRK